MAVSITLKLREESLTTLTVTPNQLKRIMITVSELLETAILKFFRYRFLTPPVIQRFYDSNTHTIDFHIPRINLPDRRLCQLIDKLMKILEEAQFHVFHPGMFPTVFSTATRFDLGASTSQTPLSEQLSHARTAFLNSMTELYGKTMKLRS